MAIRLLFLIFISLLSSDLYADLSDECPYGHRNESWVLTSIFRDSRCSNYTFSPDVVSGGCQPFNGGSTFPVYVTPQNCASTPSDDTGDSGCYQESSNPATGYCEGEKKQCNSPDGSSFFLESSKNCSDYCKGANGGPGKVHACSAEEKEQGKGGSDVGGGDPNGPTDPGGDDNDGPGCVGCNPGGDDGGNGGSDSGGGDGGPGSGESGGEDGGSQDGDLSEREEDENECGIGQINLGSGCEPLKDNCGYINGTYACSNPEPPSGCGTIQKPGELPITDCFEEEDGCGWFGEGLNAEYGCFDADDSTDCAGGILINGVCNKDDGEAPISCPAGFSLKNGSCVNNANDCPIGTSPGIGGQCTADDCPAGQYRRFGQCLDIPPTPNDPNPGNDGGGNDGGGNDGNPGGQNPGSDNNDKTDFSSVINAINNQTKSLRDSVNQNSDNIESNITDNVNSLKSNDDKNAKDIADSIDKLSESLKEDEDGDGKKCDPEKEDFLGCQAGAARGDKFNTDTDFKDLSDMVTEKRQQYQDEVNEAKERFSDLFKLTDSGYSSPFWERNLEIKGVTVDFGTTRFQEFMQYLPALVLFLAAVASARIMLGGVAE